MWEQGDLKRALPREAIKMTHGEDVKKLHHPLGPLVGQAAFERYGEFVSRAKEDSHELIFSEEQHGCRGFFVQPAIFVVNEHLNRTQRWIS